MFNPTSKEGAKTMSKNDINKKRVQLSDVKPGDKMEFFGQCPRIVEVKSVEYSKSGKTIRFHFDDESKTPWWSVKSFWEVIREA